jgi:uroporphyrin-III C-methyltransferase
MKYRDSNTPACVIENGTLPEENVIFGTLGNIAEKKIHTPAILIIGNVIKIYKKIYEFKNKKEQIFS